MARIGTLRDTFDRDMDFVATKAFKLSGAPFIPGQNFDKTLVTTRRLRQLYDGRYLRMVEPEGGVIHEVRPRPVVEIGNASVAEPKPEVQVEIPRPSKVKRVKLK